MMERTPMIGMIAGIAERDDFLGGVHDGNFLVRMMRSGFGDDFSTFDKPAAHFSIDSEGSKAAFEATGLLGKAAGALEGCRGAEEG